MQGITEHELLTRTGTRRYQGGKYVVVDEYDGKRRDVFYHDYGSSERASQAAARLNRFRKKDSHRYRTYRIREE